jgi:hypothetical protein
MDNSSNNNNNPFGTPPPATGAPLNPEPTPTMDSTLSPAPATDPSAPAPVPTWLPNQPAAAPTNTTWPDAPQDHGSTSAAGWNPAAEPSNAAAPIPEPVAASGLTNAPAWPATSTPTAPAPPDPAASSTPSSSVFPPQFSQTAPSSPEPSFTASPMPSTPDAPTPLSTPIENNAPAAWPTQAADTAVSNPTFIPPVDPSQGGAAPSFGAPADHAAPTVPDFLTSSAAPAADSNNLTVLNQPNDPNSQPADLSQMTASTPDPAAAPVYTPSVSNPDPNTPVMPAGIPETINKPAGNKSMMKWLIIAGVLVILAAAAAGTYFFLLSGKGGSPDQNFSLPANQQAPLTTPAKQVIQVTPGPTATASAEATSSAFEKLKQEKTAK